MFISQDVIKIFEVQLDIHIVYLVYYTDIYVRSNNSKIPRNQLDVEYELKTKIIYFVGHHAYIKDF